VVAPLERIIRTRFYAALTRVGPSSVAELGRRPAGRLAVRCAGALFAGGTVTITAGAAGRLLLDSGHLPFEHPLGYGIVRGVVEPSVQEALRRSVAPGMTVFDVGADIGFFSILAARLTGPGGRVEAFEPVPSSAQAVRANAALNRFANITVHEVAVADHEAREELLVQNISSQSHLAERGPHASTRERALVEVICLDERIARGELPAPDVVKIDVEGSEVAVLRGLRRTLLARPPVVICELHETNREIVELLGEIGYEVENLDGTAPVLDAGPVHILARRRP
jgi:FkbM family methyltransferase